jgi:uncharacterized UPF0146 family protein
MRTYKHIELNIAAFIASRYHNVIEIGIGNNNSVASLLAQKGVKVRATDIKSVTPVLGVSLHQDDIFSPKRALYHGADLIYAIRPGIEMVPPMIDLAAYIGCDLLIYHLGNEIYGHGGEIIDCGVILHRYYAVQNPSKSVD